MTARFRRAQGHTAETAIAFIAAMVLEFPATVVARLSQDGKFPVQSFDSCVEQNKGVAPEVRMQWVRGWIGKGAAVGLIFHRAGLWVLDLDMTGGWPEPIQDVVKQLNPPQVATPGGGHHLYFRLPEDLSHHPDLKAHINLRRNKGVSLEADLKLGGRRTLVVAPGSRTKAGSYRVVTPWHTPPVLDPRQVFPSAEICHIQKQVKFAVSDRDFEDRMARGIQYLKTAKISVFKHRGPQRSHLRHLLDGLQPRWSPPPHALRAGVGPDPRDSGLRLRHALDQHHGDRLRPDPDRQAGDHRGAGLPR